MSTGSMQYEALLLSAERVECALQAPAAPRDDPELRNAPLQWTVVSLGMMQRVQRPILWDVLVNDVRNVLPQVVAAAQLQRPLDEVIQNPPVGWDEPMVRDAMLRLLDTGDNTHAALTLSTQPDQEIYVDSKRSAAVVSEWQWSPSTMIGKIGREAAGELLRVYLSLELFADVPPEVQIFDEGEQLLLDVGSLTGPPPHRGASLVVTAHRILRDGTRRLVALYDVFVLPTAVPQAYRAEPLGDGSGSTPAAFQQFSARLQKRPGSAWNNYNLGWRETAFYAQPGESVADAIRSFNDTLGTPFVHAIGTEISPPVIATNEARGALLLEVSDFGNDPILEALIQPAAAVNPAQSSPPRSSFDRTAAWSPRRVQSTWFLLPLPDDWNVEPTPAPMTSDEIYEAVEIYREQRNIIEQSSEFERSSIVYRNGTSFADRLRKDAAELTWQTALDPGFRRVPGDKSGHLFPIDKTLNIVEQRNLRMLSEQSEKLTFEQAYRLSPILAPVLEAVMLREGENYSVLHLADQGVAQLNLFPSSPPVSLAYGIVSALQRKIYRLRSLSARLIGAPDVDERMSFASVHIEPTQSLNRPLSRADADLLRDFSLLGENLIGRALLEQSTDEPGIDFDDLFAQAAARTLALRAGASPAVTSLIVKKAAKPVFPPPKPVVVVPPPPVIVVPTPSNWAFDPTLYPQLTAAIKALALPDDTTVSTTRLLQKTGLLDYVKNPAQTVGPLTDPATTTYLESGWRNIDLMPGGMALLDALNAIRTAPPVVVTPPPPPKPVVVVDATKAAAKRARLQSLFGSVLSVQLDDSQAAALPDKLDQLVPLERLQSGQALLESLAPPQKPQQPVVSSDIAKKRADRLKLLGFPDRFLQLLNDAPEDIAKQFVALKTLPPLANERMLRALSRFTNP